MGDEDFFREYRGGLVREAQRLVNSVKALRLIDECGKDPLCLRTLQVAPGFFGLSRQALYVLIIVTCSKLYESKGGRSIPRFLRWIELHLDLFSADHLRQRRGSPEDYWLLERSRRDPITRATVQAHLDQVDQLRILPSIVTRRNKFWAHMDSEYFTDPSQLDKDAPLPWSGLNQLVELTKDILSTYSGAFDGLIESLEDDTSEDLKQLLAKLQD